MLNADHTINPLATEHQDTERGLADLVGRVHGKRIATARADPHAHLSLAGILILDRRVIADQGHQRRDPLPEPPREIRALGIGVLEHIVQHRRGNDMITVFEPGKQRGHFDRMDHEPRPIPRAMLIAMASLGKRQGSAGDREALHEAKPHLRHRRGRCRTAHGRQR